MVGNFVHEKHFSYPPSQILALLTGELCGDKVQGLKFFRENLT